MNNDRVARNATRARSVLAKSGMAVVLVLICSIAASAYTLVFRGGLRSEIPDQFTLTRTTLTYEVAPGFTKTILVSLIDIPATERANNQRYGSFFKRRQQTPADPQSPQASPPAEPPSQAVKTVTNSDLAAFRQRRIESEKAYEKRRLQLGLPTVAESRRRQAAEEADFRAELRERSFAAKEEERYWRTRARELRTEIAAVNNQINYVRGRLNEVNETASTRGSWTSTYPIWPDNYPWGNGRRRGNRPPRNIQYPYGYPNQYPYGYPQYPYGYPTGPYDYSREADAPERDDLTYRLDDLLVRRAGLASQWQVLEDEARDARVPQKWLLP
ncbi:MAG TPA: hypothetical protein VFH15_14760 [Pyrinomonadaceae bacterium]|nr:hypothetical protein [Pyrinomonadaceae bacterium]